MAPGIPVGPLSFARFTLQSETFPILRLSVPPRVLSFSPSGVSLNKSLTYLSPFGFLLLEGQVHAFYFRLIGEESIGRKFWLDYGRLLYCLPEVEETSV